MQSPIRNAPQAKKSLRLEAPSRRGRCESDRGAPAILAAEKEPFQAARIPFDSIAIQTPAAEALDRATSAVMLAS